MAYGELGPTHHSIEDLSWTRAIANLTVVVPADPAQTRAAVRWAAENPGPVYLRIPRFKVPGRHAGRRAVRAGARVRLTDGDDVTVIASGHHGVPRARGGRAAADDGIGLRVLNMSFVDPLDEAAVLDAARETRGIVTAEEATVSGGLGAAVASLVVEHQPVPMRILGVRGGSRPPAAPASCSTTSASPPTASPDAARGCSPRAALSRCCSPSTRARARPRRCSSSAAGRSSRAAPRPSACPPAARLGRAVGGGDLGQRARGGRRSASTRRSAGRVAAVGFSTQRESLVLWERASGVPLGPLLCWQDQRTAAALRAAARRRRRRTCRRAQRAAARPHVLRAQGALAARPLRPRPRAQPARRALPRDDRLVAAQPPRRRPRDRGRQRGAHAAARRPQRRDWDPELLELFDVPAAVLPRVVAVVRPVPAVRGLAPLRDGTPVTAVLGDSHAALYAHAGWRPGRVKATYGTGSSIMGLGDPPGGASDGALPDGGVGRRRARPRLRGQHPRDAARR